MASGMKGFTLQPAAARIVAVHWGDVESRPIIVTAMSATVKAMMAETASIDSVTSATAAEMAHAMSTLTNECNAILRGNRWLLYA